MKTRYSGLKNLLGIVGVAGLLAAGGCEEDEPSYESKTPSSFTVSFWGHMFDGDVKKTTARVKPGTTYRSKLICSNDGDSDTIKIYADGREICSYQTDENRMGGNGWYKDQTAKCRNFTASSTQAVFKVAVSTDEWGTWPKRLEVEELAPAQ